MKMQKSTIATAVALAIGMGMTGQAAASIYARSALDIDALNIDVIDSTGDVIPEDQEGLVRNFNFQLTNSASLNGANDIESANCSGTPGSNSCAAGSPRLDANPATLGAPSRTNNDFSFFGPGADQYSNSDSVINTAELTGDAATNTEQLAESELQGGESASANAEIQSTTGFTFEFTVDGDGALNLSFLATPNLLAAIDDPTAANAAAQGNLSTQFQLRRDDGLASAQWAPDGNGVGCSTTGGITCTENDDAFNLNGNVGVTTDGTSDAFAPGQGAFGISVAGLTAGNWTLVLNAQTSTLTTRTAAAVPEPGILALFGVGLLGLGAARRRSMRS